MRWGNLADDLIIVAVIPVDGHVLIVGVRQQSLPTLHPAHTALRHNSGCGLGPGARPPPLATPVERKYRPGREGAVAEDRKGSRGWENRSKGTRGRLCRR